MRLDHPTRNSSRAAGSAELTRRQLALVALLAFVPLPVLSLGAMLAPFPQIVERGAASFVSFASEGEAPAARVARHQVREDRAVQRRGAERPTAVTYVAAVVPKVSASIAAKPARATPQAPRPARTSVTPDQAPAPVEVSARAASAPTSAPAAPLSPPVAEPEPTATTTRDAGREGKGKTKTEGPPGQAAKDGGPTPVGGEPPAASPPDNGKGAEKRTAEGAPDTTADATDDASPKGTNHGRGGGGKP